MERICKFCGEPIERGGKIRIVLGKDTSAEAHPRCADIASAPIEGESAYVSRFEPFSSMNISPHGERIQVGSLRHLRQLENQHGVASAPFNTNGY